MKMKILAVLFMVSCGFSGSVLAEENDYTMIVTPARYSVLQVVFDVINKRSAVLVSYEQDNERSLLHVWNGSSWTEIGQHDLDELSFVQQTPTRVILIGDDELLPQTIKDSLSWLPEVVVIRQIDNANLLNEFGRIMEWSNGEWLWFAARYQLDVEDEASGIRDSSWFDQTGPIIKQDQPTYLPVPVVDESDTLNPSSTILPSPESTPRPSDLPDVDPKELDEDVDGNVDSAGAEVLKSTDDDIQEIVDELEKTNQ